MSMPQCYGGAVVPETGKELAADLYKLLTVGKADLPTVAAVYHEAVAKVDRAGAMAVGAMSRPGYFGRDDVHEAWMDLRDCLDKFLSDTEDNLGDTSRALLLAVERYASADAEAASELARLRAQHEPIVGQ